MDSKEATPYLQSETVTSSGSNLFSSSPSTYSSEIDYLSKNNIVLNDNEGDNNSKSDVKGNGSDDEGYVSGEEEFETALDKLGLVGTVGEEIGEENSDALFVDAPEKVESLPISEVVVNEHDDYVEKSDVLGKYSDAAVEDSDGSEVLDEKLGVNSKETGEIVDGNARNLVDEEIETKGDELEENGTVVDEVNEPEMKEDVAEVSVVEPKELDLVDSGDAKLTSEGDSVVDTIQVDVAGPGVVVVGETEENGDTGNKAKTKDVAEPEKTEVVGLTAKGDPTVDTIQVDSVTSGVEVVDETEENGDAAIKPEENNVAKVAIVEPEVVGPGGMKITTEGDSIVDTIQVDPVVPGVAVVGETEENSKDIDSIVGTTQGVVPGVDVVGETEETGKDIDSIVDTTQVDSVVPGVVTVIGETEENGKDVAEAAVVVPEDVKFTAEGDAIVDTIQVDSVCPGVAVVGDLEENGGDKVEGVKVPLESVGGINENSDVVEEAISTREVAVNYQSSEPSVELKPLQPSNHDAEAEVDLVNGVHLSVDRDGTLDMENIMKKPDVELEPAAVVYEGAKENGITEKIDTDGEVEDEMDDEVDPEDSMSDEETDGMVFGSSEAAKKFIEELEQGSGAGSSLDQSQRIDGQIVTDSEEEEGDTDDDEGDGKELFDSAALAALLKAATGADPDGGSITITSQDGSRLFSVERPAGLGPSLQALRPAPQRNRPLLFNPSNISTRGETEENLSEDEKKKLEKLQQIRVKFLRLVHRLGLSLEESVAAQVLYRLALLGGRQGTQTFSLDAAKQTALQLEAEDGNDLDFSLNILVLGKSGVGKSSTINAILGEEKSSIDAFETGTASAMEILGSVNGVKVKVIDTPGLKSSVMEQAYNRSVLSSVQKITKKTPPDAVLYVDRLDAQTRDLNDLPLLKTITSSLGPSTWRSAIVTLTHAASAPPDGPSGTPLSYEVFVTQRSHVVQQSIGHAVGDLRMMSPSLMNPVSLVENHRDCRKNREGNKILPNGQSWRPQLLLLCYSMKILSEASALSKPQDPLDHRKLFGFRVRSPPLPYMLSSMLQSRPHPKLPSDQNGESVDSDIDLDDFSDSDQEEEDEYDQLPPFKPLKKAQLAKLSREQTKAYFEEYDYRVKLLQKKQWREELKRMREMKKRGGKDTLTDYNFGEEEADMGAAAPIAVPLPDMALPPSFDGDNPAYRYRFLEPTSQFLARPVLDSHGWDHDCGYDGVNLEHSLAILNRFGAAYTVQITKDKKDFSISLDSSIATKLNENMSTMAGFDIQSMGKQLAYIVRCETKSKNLKKHKAAGGISFTFLGENVVPGVKIEDQIKLGKQYVLVGSAGAVKSQQETAYGANIELQRRELDYPIGQIQSNISMSIIKWRGDLALGFNSLAQFSIGRNSKVAVRAGINNKLSGQVTVRTSSSEHLSLALAAVLPTVLSIYKKLWPGPSDKFSIY
ncbi:hypothetical protein RD792_009334 [Penstemon davidsonii]|uniref:AIG1-type G domain-containing protein n=1 Tax=Penstemon davidsonii TaxID=160366 RepID=A0ABR0CZ28_9LAMI|nr:hypothetical protein RD792_009334 [Penstemon davidsonii]